MKSWSRRAALLALIALLGACAPGDERADDRDPAAPAPASGSAATDPSSPPASSGVAAAPAAASAAAPATAPLPVSQRPLPTITALPDPASIGDSPKGLINGDFAPELDHLDLVSGERFRLSRYVGPKAEEPRKAAIVSFTASWCGPCKASLPYLKEMERKFAPDLEVVLVTMDTDSKGREKELSQLRASGLQAPLLQPDHHTLRAWLGKRRNIPHLYIINAVGEILVQDRGFGKKVRKVLPWQINYAVTHPDYVVRKKKVR